MSIDQEYFDAIKELPKGQQVQVFALSHYLKKWVQGEKQLKQQIEALQGAHLKQMLPLQTEVNAIISGTRKPTAEELANRDAFGAGTETSGELKNYWGQAFVNNQHFRHAISEQDKVALQSLKSVSASLGENDKNFKLKFEFADNEFFENKVLEKEYFFNEERELPEKVTSTDIKWKNGKNLTKKIQKKKQRNKKTNQTRIIENEVQAESFFNFFEEIPPPKDQDEEMELEEKLGEHLQLGEVILEDIIPDSLGFYLGIVPDSEGDEDDGDEDDEEDEEDDEDDD